MKTIFMCCYATLQDADNSLQILLKYFQDLPSPFVKSISIREAKNKPMYPYWLGVVCDNTFIHSVDNWICGVSYPCPDFYSGPTRYQQFKQLAENIITFKNINGKMEEV